MKISVGAVLALTAASASGFSITMSSYLDNLASGSTLSSFTQSSGSATATAPAPSYAAPSASAPSAPAPAPYQSSFAELPASSSNNYIGTISGGSQMKSGPNYQGMSRAFHASSSVVSNSVYLENLKGGGAATHSNGASAPANGSFAPAPAPAFQAPSPPAPAPAPYQGSSSSSSVSGQAAGYLGSFGGGSQMKSGPNYSGVSGKFQPTRSIGNSAYLDGVSGGASAPANGASAPAAYNAAPSAPAPAPAAYNAAPSAPAPAPYQGSPSSSSVSGQTAGYLGSFGGGSQMKSGPNFTGMSGKFQPTRSIGNSAYLDGVSSGASAPANGASAPAPSNAAPSAPAPAPYQGSSSSSSSGGGQASAISGYLGSFGGGSQMKSGPNYTGMSSSFKASRSISNSVYLDSVSGANLSSFANGASANGHSAPAPAPQSYSSPAPAPAQPQASTQKPYVKPSSYMPKPSGRVANTGIGNYLDALK